MTLLTRDWGLSVGSRVWVGGHNTAAKRVIHTLLVGMVRPPTGLIDAGFITPSSVDEALYFAEKLRPRLRLGGVVWITYPPARSPRHAEFDGTEQDLVTALLELGFIGNGTAGPGDDYSSLAFRPPSDSSQ